jgi:hypothetical protein
MPSEPSLERYCRAGARHAKMARTKFPMASSGFADFYDGDHRNLCAARRLA